jgi:hypothetical protein
MGRVLNPPLPPRARCVPAGLPVYGNWCGPNYGSGTPIDLLDACCKVGVSPQLAAAARPLPKGPAAVWGVKLARAPRARAVAPLSRQHSTGPAHASLTGPAPASPQAHDDCYDATGYLSCACDQQIVSCMEGLNLPLALDEASATRLAFRKASVAYFRNTLCRTGGQWTWARNAAAQG